MKTYTIEWWDVLEDYIKGKEQIGVDPLKITDENRLKLLAFFYRIKEELFHKTFDEPILDFSISPKQYSHEGDIQFQLLYDNGNTITIQYYHDGTYVVEHRMKSIPIKDIFNTL